ncbi:glucosaminidase domain-containing protein [Bacillus sp. RG28]|uniref:Glucosaminidase domain-containing protein n=1 Tax=Gottfriedia endophytica TaxID=2820819 RepID=A0A940NGW3_9BACI|nr:glucosaminidase domain-containing protein [Gottfriedia endophytica]MBP0725184.1 glucosaminidase domain-containing protein [Gottfriedia endophytica]
MEKFSWKRMGKNVLASVTALTVACSLVPNVRAASINGISQTASGKWTATYYKGASSSGKPLVSTFISQTGTSLTQNLGLKSPVPNKVPVNNFSAKFNKNMNLSPGLYSVRVKANDVMKVLIDGKVVLNQTKNVGNKENSVSVALTNKNGSTSHAVELRYANQKSLNNFSFSIDPIFSSFSKDLPNVAYNWGLNRPTEAKSVNFQATYNQSQTVPSGDYVLETYADGPIIVKNGSQYLVNQIKDVPNHWASIPLVSKSGKQSIITTYVHTNGNAAVFSHLVPFSSYLGYYYNNPNLSGAPIAAKIISPTGKTMDLQTTYGSGSPLKNIKADGTSAKYLVTKRLKAGSYTLNVTSDSGVRVYVDGKQVLNQWTKRTNRTDAATFTVSNGTASSLKDVHRIELQTVDINAVKNIKFTIVPKSVDPSPKPDPNPGTDPTKPPVDPTKPPVDPTKPPVDPTKPPVDPTKPPVDPTKPPVNPPKPPVTLPYTVAKVGTDKKVSAIKTYQTYDEAVQQAKSQNANAVMKNNKYIWVKSGFGYTNDSSAATQNIYQTNKISSKEILTYFSKGTEVKILDTQQDVVKVQHLNLIGYMRKSDLDLYPTEIAPKSYYSLDSRGNLYHNYYINGKLYKYLYRKAPAGVSANKDGTVNTEDGIHFGTTESYSYFDYLSLHTVSNVTDVDIDNFLRATTETTTKGISPLYGLGWKFKEAEATYGVNALAIIAHTILESDYGRSKYSLDRFNLFGIGAVDSNPDLAKPFNSFEDCIDYYAQSMINQKYLKPNYFGFYIGSYFGDKSGGFNVKYASDPYWGRKIASLMSQIDAFSGSKDYQKRYQIGMVKTDTLNVRSKPVADSSVAPILYTMTKGKAFTILKTVTNDNGDKWYQIANDKRNADGTDAGPAYVSASEAYSRILNTN